MTTYLLDTDTVSYLADPASPKHAPVVEKLRTLPSASFLAIPLLTLYELAYGYRRAPGYSRILAIFKTENVGVLAPSEAGIEPFANLKEAYRRHTGIRERALARHNVDLILASTALAEGAVLVSNDGIFTTLAELEPKLIVENWAA